MLSAFICSLLSLLVVLPRPCERTTDPLAGASLCDLQGYEQGRGFPLSVPEFSSDFMLLRYEFWINTIFYATIISGLLYWKKRRSASS